MWLILILSCRQQGLDDRPLDPETLAEVVEGGPSRSDRGEVRLEMNFHLGDIERARDSVVAGDLPAAKAAFQAIDVRLPVEGLPAALRPHAERLQPIVRRGAAAPDLSAAATAVGEAMATCGECHAAAGAQPKVAAGVPERIAGPTEWMARHQWAARQLEVGLVEPKASALSEAALVLTLVPVFGELPSGQALPDEATRGVERVHAAVAAVAAAQTPLDRGRAYGEVLQTCAACHAAFRPAKAEP